MAQDDTPWSPLGFAEELAVFKGPTQNARALSEGWIGAHLFCPACGADRLTPFPNNSRVADFHCPACAEQYEVKAKKGRLGSKLVDGAYSAMTARLAAANNPSLLVMSYAPQPRRVTDLIVVPRHFFTPSIIEPRKRLGPTARRAGWQGCNILIGQVPQAGRISLIRDGLHTPKAAVLDQWQATLFLRDARQDARGWLLEVMKAVEAIGHKQFTLQEVYAHKAHLSALYPGNRHVEEKIRQQLQVLRDRGWLQFVRPGIYRRTSSTA